jgi:predicted kinase
MADNPLPGCLIVTGMPASGKSTVTRLVAQRLPRAARIDADEVHAMIVTGRVRFDSGSAEEAARQGELRAFNVCALANNFTDAGFTAIIDEVVPDRGDFDWYVEKLRGRPLLFVVLAPPLEVCQQRNAARPESDRVDYDFSDYYHSMHTELNGIGWWLDSSPLTPEETAAAIVARANTEAAVAG